MYNMMTTTGWDYGFTALWGVHIFSVVAFFTGVLFLIVLAVKTFTPAQLKTWAIWLIVTGTIACLFTIAMIGGPWTSLHSGRTGMSGVQMQQMGQMMDMMMDHDDADPNAEHDEIEGMMRGMMQ